jgi:hypothetical protein
MRIAIVRLILGLSYLLVPAFAVDAAQWANVYSRNDSVRTGQVRPISGGAGYVIFGSDAWLMKLDSDGAVVWQKSFERPDFSAYFHIESAEVSDDGGIVVAGNTVAMDLTPADGWVMKVGGDGNIIWQKKYGGPGRDLAKSVHPTSDGGYVVAGETRSYGSDPLHPDAWILRLDANGGVLWQKTYGGAGLDSAASVRPTNDGGFIVAGYSASFGVGGIWLLKLDATGAVEWEKAIGTGFADKSEIYPTADGGYIFVTDTNRYTAGITDAWVIRLDASGNIVWQETFGGVNADVPFSVAPTSDGGYVLAGMTAVLNAPEESVHWLIKLDALGRTEWQRSYDWRIESVRPLRDGGYVGAAAGAGIASVLKLGNHGTIAGCPLVGPSALVPVPSDAIPRNTSASVTASGAVPIDTNAIGTNTNLVMQRQCYAAESAYTEVPTLGALAIALMSLAVGVAGLRATARLP